MKQYILEFSKYFITLFSAVYMYECFAVFRFKKEEDRKGIYLRQNILLFLVHFGCFCTIILKTGKLEYLFFFLFQQIALYTTIVLYHMLYPKASRLVVNNMSFLMAIGFVMLTRLSYDKAVRQFLIVAAGLILSLAVPAFMIKEKRLHQFTWIYASVGIISLGIVLLLGSTANGSKLSFSLFGFAFQPSEMIKILFVLCIASILNQKADFKRVALSAVIAGAHILILTLSKDLGSALIFFVAFIIMVFVSTHNFWYLLAGIFSGTGASVLAYRLFSHVRIRVLAWRDPWSVIDGAGYQITQSLFAIGCGGLFGLGLYKGSPSSIPFVTTDFIFSAISEEMGLLFSICLLLIYLSSFIMFMNIAMSMKDDFCRIATVGLSVTYIFQIFLTVGGGIKLIPLTGVTLPLISYGGSSVISTLLMFSVIQGLYLTGGNQNALAKNKDEEEKPGDFLDND